MRDAHPVRMGLKTRTRQLAQAIRAPGDTLRKLYKKYRMGFMETLAAVCRSQSFYLQARMDIDQKSAWYGQDFSRKHGGFFLANESVSRKIADFEPWDSVRRDMILLLLRMLNERRVVGDLVELGVYRGLTAKLLHDYMPDRVLHLFDTFKGFDPTNIARERQETGLVLKPSHFANTSVERVLNYIRPQNENIRVYPGFFPQTVPTAWVHNTFAFVHLDADLYEPILAGLKIFYPKVSSGGCIVVHDYNSWPGARKAVDEFFADKPEVPIPMPDKSGSVLIVKH